MSRTYVIRKGKIVARSKAATREDKAMYSEEKKQKTETVMTMFDKVMNVDAKDSGLDREVKKSLDQEASEVSDQEMLEIKEEKKGKKRNREELGGGERIVIPETPHPATVLDLGKVGALAKLSKKPRNQSV